MNGGSLEVLAPALKPLEAWLRGIKKNNLQSSALEKALRRLQTAALETRHQIGSEKRAGRRRVADKHLYVLWSKASVALSKIDPDLASRCFAKATYWADPSLWGDKRAADARIALKSIEAEVERLLKPSTAEASDQKGQTPPRPASSGAARAGGGDHRPRAARARPKPEVPAPISAHLVADPVALNGGSNRVDFAVITIREDESEAVLRRLEPTGLDDRERRYRTGTILIDGGARRTFALVRCPEQGEQVALDVTRDVISDVDPHWIVLCGICGCVPSKDFTLGDVICATRVTDFSVQAAIEKKTGEVREFNSAGGPMHRRVENLLADLPAMKSALSGWNSGRSIGLPKPAINVRSIPLSRLYGGVKWRRSVVESLEHHFPEGKRPRAPLFTTQPVVSSDVLTKSTRVVEQWQQTSRSLAAIEMELAGVYRGARRISGEYPVLAIRGISDVVGFKREEAWTKYACESSAAFMTALIKAGGLLNSGSNRAESAPFSGKADALIGHPTAAQQRRQDVAELRRVFRTLHTGVVNNFLNEARSGYLLYSFVAYFWPGFEELFDSVGFHIYDSTAIGLVGAFYSAVAKMIAQSDGMHFVSSGLKLAFGDIPTDAGFAERTATFRAEAGVARDAYQRLLRHVRENYAEIDLVAIDQASYTEYLEFMKEQPS